MAPEPSSGHPATKATKKVGGLDGWPSSVGQRGKAGGTHPAILSAMATEVAAATGVPHKTSN